MVLNLNPSAGQRIAGGDGPQPPETVGWSLNHTCYRISNPEASLRFYRDGLGLRIFFVFNTGLFTIYYLGYPPPGTNEVTIQHVSEMQTRSGLLELLHFPSVTSSSDLHSGNLPGNLGYGHIGITVPDVEAALKRLEEFGAKVVKPLGTATDPALEEGHAKFPEGFAKVLKKIAFVEDPDGFWVELVPIKIHG